MQKQRDGQSHSKQKFLKQEERDLLISFLDLLHISLKVWINVKIENTMRDVDRQVEDIFIKKDWDGFLYFNQHQR